jgi:hypothetical protein
LYRRATDVPPKDDPSIQLLLRSRLDRESEILMHRTAWVVGSQAFLFSAYAIALNGHPEAPFVAQSRLLMHLVSWVSITSLALFQISVWGGVTALVNLRRHVVLNEDPRLHLLEVSPRAHLSGLAAPVLVPFVFFVAWVILIYKQ